MASILKANLNLAAIPKDKIYKGKKGSPIYQSQLQLTTNLVITETMDLLL